MTPNSASRADFAAPARLCDLPDGLLVRCLSQLSQPERFEVVACVSKRLSALTLEPALLRNVSLSLAGDGALRLRSLLGFLTQHAAHVHVLTLEENDEEEEDPWEAEVLLASCLSACAAAARRMRVLALRVPPPDTLAWLPALTSLRELRLGLSYYPLELRLPAGFSRLVNLAEATLGGSPLEFEGSRLPGGLTAISIADRESTQMPAQFSTLTALRTLDFRRTCYTSCSMGQVLTALTALTALKLPEALPACLARLTSLQVLFKNEELEPAGCAALGAALPALTRLSCLGLNCADLAPILPAAAQLPLPSCRACTTWRCTPGRAPPPAARCCRAPGSGRCRWWTCPGASWRRAPRSCGAHSTWRASQSGARLPLAPTPALGSAGTLFGATPPPTPPCAASRCMRAARMSRCPPTAPHPCHLCRTLTSCKPCTRCADAALTCASSWTPRPASSDRASLRMFPLT